MHISYHKYSYFLLLLDREIKCSCLEQRGTNSPQNKLECKSSRSFWVLNDLISITEKTEVKILVSPNVDPALLTDSIFCRCFHRTEKLEAAKFTSRRWKLIMMTSLVTFRELMRYSINLCHVELLLHSERD